MTEPEGYVVDFPTLGDLHEAWAKQHCVVPQGHRRGAPYVMADWQFWCSAKHYEIRPEIGWDPDDPPMNQAFVHRRSQIVGPQKTGKGPLAATFTAFEAVGPSQFCGWAEPGDGYSCSDWGCSCGFEYEYLPGEPMGMRHPSPTIQLTATSQDQVDNTLTPLRYMIRRGPLADILLDREEFIRIIGDDEDPDLDRIDAVTSAANSKLGNPISFAVQDETGIWTKTNKMMGVADTQRRGLAGMKGRSIETTNAWDPAEASVAQRTWESQRPDIFRFFRIPPSKLRWGTKRDRRRILEYVYEGSWWVNLDSIEAEAMEIAETDPAQAERFFGNRLVQGRGHWLPEEVWLSAYAG